MFLADQVTDEFQGVAGALETRLIAVAAVGLGVGVLLFALPRAWRLMRGLIEDWAQGSTDWRDEGSYDDRHYDEDLMLSDGWEPVAEYGQRDYDDGTEFPENGTKDEQEAWFNARGVY